MAAGSQQWYTPRKFIAHIRYHGRTNAMRQALYAINNPNIQVLLVDPRIDGLKLVPLLEQNLDRRFKRLQAFIKQMKEEFPDHCE